jgi:hypothetical protein
MASTVYKTLQINFGKRAVVVISKTAKFLISFRNQQISNGLRNKFTHFLSKNFVKKIFGSYLVLHF